MHRREFVAAGGTLFAGALAGCTSLDPGEGGHPFDGKTIGVRIDDASTTEHDLETISREALSFWETHSQEYAGFAVDFELGVDTDADLVLAFADDPSGCEGVEGFSELVLGCAPVLGPGTRVPSPVVARVVAAVRPPGKIRITTKHEIGHVLGLGHDDEPLEIMSNQPADRIPLYGVRIDIWEAVLEVNERSGEAIRLLTHAVDRWNHRQYDAAEAAFDAVHSDFETIRSTFDMASDLTTVLEADARVETVDLETLRALLDRLESRREQISEFAASMADASAAMAAGETVTADEHRVIAQESLDAYRAVGEIPLRDIAIALGLVRGFERDEPVIDVEDEIPPE